jgi:hypothetical protein
MSDPYAGDACGSPVPGRPLRPQDPALHPPLQLQEGLTTPLRWYS